MTNRRPSEFPEDGFDAEISGIEFLPLDGKPKLDDAAFSLMHGDDNQVLKTPFGMIKITFGVDGEMGDLADELKTIFTSGLSISGIEKLNAIIKASPKVREVLNQVPGLKHFLDLALDQMRKNREDTDGDWKLGAMTLPRLRAAINQN